MLQHLIKEHLDFYMLTLPVLDAQNTSTIVMSKMSSEMTNINSYLMSSSVKLKKEYYVALVQLYYSIDCDEYFPFYQNNKFFDWKHFNQTLQLHL